MICNASIFLRYRDKWNLHDSDATAVQMEVTDADFDWFVSQII
jgi:hypothetical protein